MGSQGVLVEMFWRCMCMFSCNCPLFSNIVTYASGKVCLQSCSEHDNKRVETHLFDDMYLMIRSETDEYDAYRSKSVESSTTSGMGHGVFWLAHLVGDV